jgi:sigma-B regulation protein RsbU (phosphoserine phosphatase)
MADEQHVAPENLTPEHLRTLYQVATWINSTLDFDSALDNAMDAIMQVMKAQRGFLMIHDDDENTLRVLVARGIDGETIEEEGYSTTVVNEVVRSREPLLTNNAQFDERLKSGDSIIMRGLRAILCAPMMVQDRLIGVVYVDTSMRTGIFREDDKSLLEAISALAARTIENARLYQVAKEKGRLERELQMASEIQRGLLPSTMPDVSTYEVAPHWEAAREVAGDFYDAFELDNGSIGTVIADVSDKGAPAALFMAVARTLIRSHAHAGMSAVETVRRANDLLLIDADRSGMFVTLYFSRFEPDGHSVHVNGGHNPPAVYRSDSGEVEYMPLGGRALGWFPDNPVEAIELELTAGDVVIYYTDGLTEAENPEGEPYGEDRLAAVLAEAGSMERAVSIRDTILEDVETFCAGQSPFDDLTMLVVRYMG